MNYEKMCYSFMGSLIAGTVIQNNMGLSWQYFIVVTLCLWGICIGLHWFTYKREQELKKQSDSQKQEIHNDELERVLTAIGSSADKHLQCLKEEMNFLKETQAEAQNKFMKDIRIILDSLEKTQKEILKLNEQECQCWDKCLSDLADNSNYYEKVISIITNIKNNNILSRKDLLDKLISVMNENNLAGNKKIDEWRENHLQGISKLEQGLSGIKNVNGDILSDIGKLTEAVNNNGEAVIENITRISTLLSEVIVEADKIIHEMLQQFQSSIDNSSTNVSNTLIRTNDITNSNIKKVSDDFRGMISNLQGEMEAANQSLSGIKSADVSNADILENINNNIVEVKNSIDDGVSSLSDSLADSRDKQGEIIAGEEDVLKKYDVLLSRINDEIIVKMISDSNNLLKCMRDCYNLLERLRRDKGL